MLKTKSIGTEASAICIFLGHKNGKTTERWVWYEPELGVKVVQNVPQQEVSSGHGPNRKHMVADISTHDPGTVIKIIFYHNSQYIVKLRNTKPGT